jgi:TRAP-type C4-dicarboxylate transport system permease small subunit
VNKIFHWLDKVSSVINKVFVFIASVMMAGLMILVCVDQTLRYAFNSPLIWGTEVTEILLLYITFLATAQVLRDNSHVVVDVFLAVASERRRRVLGFISHSVVVLIAAVLVYFGFSTTYNLYVRGVFNPTIIETPIALITIIIPIGSIPLLLEALIKLRGTLSD